MILLLYVRYDVAIFIQVLTAKKENGSRAYVVLNQIADQVKTFMDTLQFIDLSVLFISFHAKDRIGPDTELLDD
jgi:hypothetical protein